MEAAHDFLPEGYTMGTRIPRTEQPTDTIHGDVLVKKQNIPSRIVGRSPSTTTSASSSTTSCKAGTVGCDLPPPINTTTIAIAVSIVVPLVAAIAIFFYLHRRSVQNQRKEDAKDADRLDFGMDEKKSKRKSLMHMMGDKKSRGLSMDMNLSSPYLLATGHQDSRDSLNSLARTLKGAEDPYQPVTAYVSNEKTRATSALSNRSSSNRPSPLSQPSPKKQRRSDRAKSPLSASPSSSLTAVESPASQLSMPYPAEKGDYEMTPRPLASARSQSFPREVHSEQAVPAIQEPPPVAKRDSRRKQSNGPRQAQYEEPQPQHQAQEAAYHGNEYNHQGPQSPEPVGLGVVSQQQPQQQQQQHIQHVPTVQEPNGFDDYHQYAQHMPEEPSAYGQHNMHHQEQQQQQYQNENPHAYDQQHDYNNQQHYNQQTPEVTVEEPMEYYDYGQQEPQNQYAQQQQQQYAGERGRGRGMNNGGLAPPQQRDNRRRSVGFRPLPPANDAEMESEDPEVRANRIRSFYKEYFDESKNPQQRHNNNNNHGGAPPMPQQQQQAANYYDQYDDDDDNYLGDAAYFDPDTNQFIMPSYAQPVTRRAMTPPPTSSRRPMQGGGPRGPPRAGGRGPPQWDQGSAQGYSQHQQLHHQQQQQPRRGSLGGMSHDGFRQRAGSTMSAGYGPRPGSSASARLQGRAGGPRRPMKPLAALNTLPTPGKLKEDSALFTAGDFAPPRSYGDRAAGRSQSPLGERRAYAPKVPVASPLVSAYDDIATLPSPHILRKSSTFTGLDFAPPKRFKDAESPVSDAGSIRSNRSGLSAAQVQAIRSGAGRVSRLPGDTVFTAAQSGAQLKPTWKVGS